MGLEETVIKNLKKYRKIRNISQEKLAEKCNTTTSYIGLMEIGRNIPKLSTIERIAAALEIEPHILFLDEKIDTNEDRKHFILNEIKKILDANL